CIVSRSLGCRGPGAPCQLGTVHSRHLAGCRERVRCANQFLETPIRSYEAALQRLIHLSQDQSCLLVSAARRRKIEPLQRVNCHASCSPRTTGQDLGLIYRRVSLPRQWDRGAGISAHREVIMHGTQEFNPALSIIWPPPDQMLIEAVAGGDKKALEQLFARHSPRIYRFVLRITGNAALSEDIVSEVFLEVWRRPGRFEGKAQVSTWMFAIAR